MRITLTPEILLAAYTQGIFPMADAGDSDLVHWVCPEMRGQLCVKNMHVPRRLKKTVRHMKLQSGPYEIRIDSDFPQTMKLCAQEREGRRETWINDQIINAYTGLYESGYAHSVECWQNGAMIGGLYGVSIGGAFFGESMFSRERDASKVALVHLVARLYHAGYRVLDTQFTNSHLEQFGVYEIPHQEYLERLEPILQKNCIFDFNDPKEADLICRYFDRA